MKLFVSSLILFVLVIVGVCFSTLQLCRITDGLLADADAVPISESVSFQEKKAALEKLDAAFSEKLFFLSASVNRRSIAQITEKMAIAKGYAVSEDSEEFTAAIYALRAGLEELHENAGFHLTEII
ncbi:MAG: DUF4363 family protein [Clostridia bacterium]|nr:DUF4363 family protein [Clostridia bacterium]